MNPIQNELRGMQDELMQLWMGSREKSISDCIRDFLGETRPCEPAMLYEAMKDRGVEGIILVSQCGLQEKFQIRKGDKVLREIELPNIRFCRHFDNQRTRQ